MEMTERAECLSGIRKSGGEKIMWKELQPSKHGSFGKEAVFGAARIKSSRSVDTVGRELPAKKQEAVLSRIKVEPDSTATFCVVLANQLQVFRSFSLLCNFSSVILPFFS